MYANGFLAKLPFQLSDSLHIWSTLNISDGTTDFGNHKIVVVLLSEQLDITLNLVRDVRNHLYGLAEIVAPTLLVYNCLIDASCCQRVCFCCLDVRKSLVVTEVKVCLHTVNRYVALSVLVWVERSWVDVYIRIEFLDGDIIASCLKKLAY